VIYSQKERDFIMDKIGKNLGVIVLGVLFLIAALIYARDYLAEQGRENEGEENSTSFPFEKIYTAGEDVMSVNVLCQVHQAEIFTDYEELSSFYKERDYLVNPREYLMQSSDLEGVFPEEVQFIHLNFSLTNYSEMEKIFTPCELKLTSISDSYQSESWGNFFACDGEYQIGKKGSKTKKINLSGKNPSRENTLEFLSILPNETAVIDFVGEFLLYRRDDMEEAYKYSEYFANYFFENNDLYLSISGLGTEITTGNGLRGEKIRLDIDCGHQSGTREIQEMKSRSWTNLERSQSQTESYSFASVQEELGYSYNVNKETTQLLGFWLTDWKDLPEEYVKRGNLQQMAQRYRDVYGYETEELKVLFLDVGYSTEAAEIADMNLHCLYKNSFLYLTKNEREWYIFGTADEWKVTENSGFPEQTGFFDFGYLKEGESLRVELAYILPPDVYRQQKELYFFGACPQNILSVSEDIPVTKILL